MSKKVTSGEPLNIPAKTYNDFINASDFVKKQQDNTFTNTNQTGRDGSTIKVRNDTGTDFERWDVIGLGDSVITPTDNMEEWESKIVLEAEEADYELHINKWAIVTEPIADGKFGTAVASGVVQAEVNILEDFHEYCDLDEDGKLSSSMTGCARIIYKEDETGTTYCVIRISNNPFVYYELEKCDLEGNDEDTLLVVNNLKEQLENNQIVKYGGYCYKVLAPKIWDFDCVAPVCVIIPEGEDNYASCAACDTCWLLTDCTDSENTIITATDLHEYENLIIRLDSDEKCYTVTLSEDCSGSEDIGSFTDYGSCADCAICYTLESCCDSAEIKIINDLATLFGETPSEIVTAGRSVVIGGECYEVTAQSSTGCETAGLAVIDSTAADCDACGCYLLTPCDTGSNIYACAETNGIDLGASIGKIAKISDLCYTISAATTGCAAATTVTIQEIYDSCSECVCYLLEDCESVEADIITFTDLSASVGKVIKISDVCYEVSISSTCTGSVEITSAGEYTDCDTCLELAIFKCDASACADASCNEGEGGGGVIYTNTDLSGFVGQYIDSGGSCYYISRDDSWEGDTEEFTIGGSFGTCVACLASFKEFEQPILWDAYISGNSLFFRKKTLIIKKGVIINICIDDDVEVSGTDCPEV